MSAEPVKCGNCGLDLSTVKYSWRGYEHPLADCIARLKASVAARDAELAAAEQLCNDIRRMHVAASEDNDRLEAELAARDAAAPPDRESAWCESIEAAGKDKDKRIAGLEAALKPFADAWAKELDSETHRGVISKAASKRLETLRPMELADENAIGTDLTFGHLADAHAAIADSAPVLERLLAEAKAQAVQDLGSELAKEVPAFGAVLMAICADHFTDPVSMLAEAIEKTLAAAKAEGAAEILEQAMKMRKRVWFPGNSVADLFEDKEGAVPMWWIKERAAALRKADHEN